MTIPFIITTKPDACPEGMEHCRCVGHTSRAVATIEETREHVIVLMHDAFIRYDQHHDVWSSVDDFSLTKSGGTIGPLPDGTTIEVQHVSYGNLWREVAGSKDNQPVDTTNIIGAYNARQERRSCPTP